MLNLREKDLQTGRHYLDRMNILLYLCFVPWLLAFCGIYLHYNNKVTGISPEKIPVLWSSILALALLGCCVWVYLVFTKNLKNIPGKPLPEKLSMYYVYNKWFYVQLNLLAMVATALYAVLNAGPLVVFNCFMIMVVSLEKPGEARLFRHLRLKQYRMRGFKDRNVLEND